MLREALPKLVEVATAFWDFIDKRDIDKHVMSWAVFVVTVYLLIWSARFAQASPRPGMDVAAILGAIWAPWNLVQAGVIAWYFRARSEGRDEH